MFGHLRRAALAIGALLAPAGLATAGDTVRLVDRPADRTDTRTLELKPADRAANDTELTRWGRGGWGGGWGHGGWGHVGWGHGGWGHGGWGGWGWGHHHHGWGLSVGLYGGWGYGGWGGYWPRGYGYYGWPYASYALYSPAYYSVPAYSYYAVPAVSYYAAPAYYYSSPIVSSACCPTVISESPVRVESSAPAAGPTYRYDGGSGRPIPPAERMPPSAEPKTVPVPTVPADPAVPKVGPTPSDRKVSRPALRKQFEYPAYGEGPDAPKPTLKPAKELLVQK